MKDIRFNYHFEPKKGWMNDPNGLCYFNGKYHAFFQHNPHEPKWDVMHWGHAISNDLIHWEELPIALYPDKEYENAYGCFSGSALEIDNKLVIFYTAVGKELGQTQCMATTFDCENFVKHADNPLIATHPQNNNGEYNQDFRDPKLIKAFDKYFLVVAGGKNGMGQIFLYSSINLTAWKFESIIFESDKFGVCLECPDLFFIDEKWVLAFSAVKPTVASTVFLIGDFNGNEFKIEKECYSELCRDFYAPQTFENKTGERIMIGWMNHPGRELAEWETTAGGFTIPRKLTYKNGYIYNYPIEEAQNLLISECEFVKINGTTIEIYSLKGELLSTWNLLGINGIEKIEHVDILFDKKMVEIFINGGLVSISQWLV